MEKNHTLEVALLEGTTPTGSAAIEAAVVITAPFVGIPAGWTRVEVPDETPESLVEKFIRAGVSKVFTFPEVAA